MRLFKLFLFGIFLVAFWSCSDLGDPEISGCMTSTACNYDPDATNDDGSCVVPTECDTCEDNAVVVGGALDGICDTCEDGAIVDNDADNDTVCDADESAGCTISTACNYNASATDDDGLCAVPTECDTCEDNAVVVDGALDVCDTCVDDAIVDNDADDDGVCDADEVTGVSYSTQIQPIFTSNCNGCHIGGTSGGLSLNSYTNLMAGGNSGPVVEVGNGAGSLLVKKLRDEHVPSMPLGNCCIESSLIDLIETWIDEGALEEPND